MHRDRRPHLRRRDDALDRHRSLGGIAAVAGIAGTAAFSLMAAMSWSGNPDAKPLPTSGAVGDTGGDTGGDIGGFTVEPTAPTRTRVQVQTAPNGGFVQPPTVTAPRTGRGSGGHAATGGSN